MKSISPTIEVGGKDLGLHQRVSIDGRTVVDEPADTLMGTFIELLWVLMSVPKYKDQSLDDLRKTFQLVPPYDQAYDAEPFTPASQGDYGDGRYEGVTVDTSVVPAELDFTNTSVGYADITESQPDVPSPGKLILLDCKEPGLSGPFVHDDGTTDPTPEVLKLHEPTFNERAEVTSYSALDLTGAGVNDGNIGRFWVGYVSDAVIFNEVPLFLEPREDIFSFINIVLGRNDAPNSIERPFSGYADWEFSTSGFGVSQPANQTNASTITIAKDFTNNTGRDVTTEEIMLLCALTIPDSGINGTPGGMLARDVKSLTISDGSTVNISYEITVDNTGGGLMKTFMGLLYRHLANTSFEVSVVDGISRSAGPTNLTFNSVYGSAGAVGAYPYDRDPNVEFYRIGPMVGTDGTAVDNSQEFLKSEIPHGQDAGELLHRGTFTQPISKDPNNNKYTFTLSRFFENQSGGDITINETGLYCLSDEIVTQVHMIARHTPSAVTVSNGELLQVDYTFELSF